jgi:hypothetical protein
MKRECYRSWMRLPNLEALYDAGLRFCLRLLPNGAFEIRCGNYLQAHWPDAVAVTLEDAVSWLTAWSHGV